MDTQLTPLAWDTETHPIALCQNAPAFVCISTAVRMADGPSGVSVDLSGNAPGDMAKTEMLIDAILSGDFISVCHNQAYDLAVLAAKWPHLIPRIWTLLTTNKATCTAIREKLLVLANTGDLEWMTLPDGSKKKREWSLAALVMHYFQVDISASKSDPNAWRLNYNKLDGIPADQYPSEARNYAIDDSFWALMVYERQEQERARIWQLIGKDPLATQYFQAAADYSLMNCSAWGLAVNPDEARRTHAAIMADVAPEKMKPLVDAGILRPARPPQPHALGHQNHVEGCRKKWVEGKGADKRIVKCSCPVKMTAPEDESIDTAALHAHVIKLAGLHPEIKLRYTSPSTTHPNGQLSVNGEFLDDYHQFCPLLQLMKVRSDLGKMVTTELPRMMMKDEKGQPIMGCPSPVVHPRFDVLKETGRTSSYADKTLPSMNVQNVDPRARGAYEAREGRVLASVDFTQMELCTLAQQCYTVLGHSQLRELINRGEDLHAWLGAQIALISDQGFSSWCQRNSVHTRDDAYHAFVMLKESTDPNMRAFYEHYRKLAKPTGLGYPGGLAEDTFIEYAKATYGVTVDRPTATMLKSVWRSSLPEMDDYFNYIKGQCRDPINDKIQVKDKKSGEFKYVDAYSYTTPFGMYRAACGYCAAANGIGLQSPSSEAAKLALINVVRACTDPTLGSILCDDINGVNVRVLGLIHDELLCEVREDEHTHDRVMEIRRIMIESLRILTPDVTPRAEAALMRRWDKNAKPRFDQTTKKLIVWEPKAKEA